jgi:Holliday junction resolvase-like predicted endonuclease
MSRPRTPALSEHVDRALAWLVDRGYRFVARSLRLGHQEIDLVVGDGPQTVFVVVKVVRGRGFGGAIELADRRTTQRLVRAVSRYLAENPGVPSVRIDVVAVALAVRGGWRLEHSMNAVP